MGQTKRGITIAILNEKGKEKIGHIFNKGEVPIRSPIPIKFRNKDEQKVEGLLIDLREVTGEQWFQLKEYMNQTTGRDMEVLKQVQTTGILPIDMLLIKETKTEATLYFI